MFFNCYLAPLVNLSSLVKLIIYISSLIQHQIILLLLIIGQFQGTAEETTSSLGANTSAANNF